MGIFSRFKNIFKKDIILDCDISSHLIYVYKLRKGQIRLNRKVIVPNNFDFVIAKKGKVFDILKSGEHELSLSTLPKSVKKFGLDKADSDGKLPKTFEANAYFVNLKLFEYSKWESYRKITLTDKCLGNYSIRLEGGFAFKVADSFRFVNSLLKIYDYLKNDEAESILESFLSEFVVDEIEKNNYKIEQVSNLDVLTDLVYEKLCERMVAFGIEIQGFLIEKMGMTKNLKNYLKKIDVKQNQQKIDTNIKKEYSINSCTNQNLALEQKQNKKIRCLLCGFENNAVNERCAICNEKLEGR